MSGAELKVFVDSLFGALIVVEGNHPILTGVTKIVQNSIDANADALATYLSGVGTSTPK